MKTPTNQTRRHSTAHPAPLSSKLMHAVPFLIGSLVLILLMAVASCRRSERPAVVAPATTTADEKQAAEPWASDSAEYTDESPSHADESAALPDDATGESTGGDLGEKDAEAPEAASDDEWPGPSEDDEPSYDEPSHDEPAGDDPPSEDTWEG